MKKLMLFITAISSAFVARTQNADSIALIGLNQRIDDMVVKQDTNSLKLIYAEDFVFSHGSGKIEGKSGWMKSVGKGNFLARQHDSVTVELHPALAILRGKLSVQKKNKEKVDKYHLKYVRVYAYRGKWELVSHLTVGEWHE